MKHIRNFIADFRSFIAESNFIEVAVGVLIAGAIKDMANSFTGNIVTPLLKSLAELCGFDTGVTASFSVMGVEFGIIEFFSSILAFFIILFVAYLIITIFAGFKKRFYAENDELEKVEELEQIDVLKDILAELKSSNKK